MQKTQEEWRNVFYVCAAFDLFGAIVYGLFSSGEIQSWSRDDVVLPVESGDGEKVPITFKESELSIKDLNEDSTHNEAIANDTQL